MKDSPKILLASTINVIKEYCLYEWLNHIKKLTYPNLEIFLVDNSFLPSFSHTIREGGFNCFHEKPAGREARYFMASSLERCRIKFLAGDYDYFFNCECDIFPPVDIIERLLAHNLDIVGTTYWTEHGYNSRLQLREIYCLNIDFEKHEKTYKPRFLTFEEAQMFMDGQCKPIYANGIGCTLIKRWMLEKFKFRIGPDDAGFADSFFHTDIWEAGIDNYVDTSIIPKHKNLNWNTVLGDTAHKKMQIARGDLKLNK
jgi:hypothetical protein